MANPSIDEKLRESYREAEEREAQGRAAKLNLPYLNLATSPIEIEALALVPEGEAKKANLAVFERKKNILAIAALNPNAAEAETILNHLKGTYALTVYVVSLSSLKHAWSFYEYAKKEQKKITGQVEPSAERLEELEKALLDVKKVEEEVRALARVPGATTQILEVLLAGALAFRASDIHFEALEKNARIRFRIDGILTDAVPVLEKETYKFLMNRIKLLSNMKLNIADEAQDGRFTIKYKEKSIEMRVSVIPSEYGESAVLRVLDPTAISLGLGDLGIRKDDLEIVLQEIKRPNGLILNTGPTGSGKTTTLYAFLKHMYSPDIKIITVEDPIEYHLAGIEQTQVDTASGYTFASGLRSILRHDPDAILVGEVRDKETAEIAINAALTGHIVFSTLHTNDAVGAVPRLVDLGVKPELIGPALTLIIAQRLTRRLCEYCKAKAEVSEELKKKITAFLEKLPQRVEKGAYQKISIYKPVGCTKCHELGYKGRVGIYEFLKVNDELRELITKDISPFGIKKQAKEKGMTTMQEDGILKVLAGITTLEEVEAATGPIEW
jgi:type II secretory ATPase GspE/PulE/Tfp pilus assembly ATPase PilB-like protein